MAETDTDSFYGDQLLNSIVDGEKMVLNLPGGAKVAMADQETTYTVPDHEQSVRVTAETDNTISKPVTYTPFGDNQSTGLTESYTGMTFEPETATYDYHARGYDPTVARFTSVDAIRESISPYSYTENNPINFVDLNGLGRVSLYMYSMYGVRIPEREGSAPSLRRQQGTVSLSMHQHLPGQVVEAPLEHGGQIVIPNQKENTVEHLTLLTHGNSAQKTFTMFDLAENKVISKTPEGLASYLRDRIMNGNPEAYGTLKSIFLGVSEAACCNEPGGQSMAHEFARVAGRYFPNLEKVIATPYMTSFISAPVDDPTRIEPTTNQPLASKDIFIGLRERDPQAGRVEVKLTGNEFFHGNFGRFLTEPTTASVGAVGFLKPGPGVQYSRHTELGAKQALFGTRPTFFKKPTFVEIPTTNKKPTVPGFSFDVDRPTLSGYFR